jgi:type II secretory pathway pseudopilin PulG
MRRIASDERGTTLTELLAAMTIAVILFGAAVVTFVTFLDTSRKSDNQIKAQETARKTMEHLTSLLRNSMSTGANGAQPIQSVADFDLVFLATDVRTATNNVNNPRGLVYHRYCLGNANNKDETLWHQTAAYHSTTRAAPPATSKCPDVAWTTKERAATNLVNRINPATPLFVPTTESGVITRIAINAKVDLNTDERPPATELLSEASFRNVNRGPTASMTCKGLANGHAICDASASSDPDGHALSYEWTVGGALQTNEKTYRLDYSGLSSGASRLILLKVTDSGGSTSTTSQTVYIP